MPTTIDDVRALALGLPETTEVPTWGEFTWRVRNKIFVIASDESTAASVKCTVDDQTELVASDPETFSVAPYTGRFGWSPCTCYGSRPRSCES